MHKFKRLSEIKALSFYGDGTLWDFEKVMRHALRYALEELKHCVPEEKSVRLSIEKMIHIRNQVALELKGKEVNLERIRALAFQRTLETIGIDDKETPG